MNLGNLDPVDYVSGYMNFGGGNITGIFNLVLFLIIVCSILYICYVILLYPYVVFIYKQRGAGGIKIVKKIATHQKRDKNGVVNIIKFAFQSDKKAKERPIQKPTEDYLYPHGGLLNPKREAIHFYQDLNGNMHPIKLEFGIETITEPLLDELGNQAKNERNELLYEEREVPKAYMTPLDIDVELWSQNALKEADQAYRKPNAWEKYGASIIFGGTVVICFVLILVTLDKVEAIGNAVGGLASAISSLTVPTIPPP